MGSITLQNISTTSSNHGAISRRDTLELERGGLIESNNDPARDANLSPNSHYFEKVVAQTVAVQDKEELLSDYRRLKSKAGADVLGCLVWYGTFTRRPTAPGTDWPDS